MTVEQPTVNVICRPRGVAVVLPVRDGSSGGSCGTATGKDWPRPSNTAAELYERARAGFDDGGVSQSARPGTRPDQAVCDHYRGSACFLLHTRAYFDTAECLLIVERSGLRPCSLDCAANFHLPGRGPSRDVGQTLGTSNCWKSETVSP
jgi:hypothetical protein